MSSFEKPFPEDFDLQKAIQEILSAPEWEGFAIPKPDKIRRYIKAAKIVTEVFGSSENVQQVLSEPEPFHDDCGGEVYIYCDTEPYAFAVFKNPDAVSAASEFVSLVDSLSVTAERTANGEPMICVHWDILDVFEK